MPHPHPLTEAMRYALASKLRLTYRELCQSREGKLIFFSGLKVGKKYNRMIFKIMINR